MKKLKTRKSVAKRIKITKTGKAIKRRAGQDHFNSRERGVTTMSKRRDDQVSKSIKKIAKKFMPYL